MKGILLLGLVVCFATTSLAATDKVICYYGSWANYRQGAGKFDVEDISTDLCTHAIFTFLGLNSDGTIKILDSWNEIDKKALERFANLKLRNPGIKLLTAIGGWNEGSTTYSQVINSPTLRNVFVQSIVNFVAKYGYDGIDIDWEYPGLRGGVASDRDAFVLLLQELRGLFDAKGWLLSAAVAATKTYHATSYDVPKLSQYLDLLNVMAYDLHGSWDGRTGQNAPLYASKIDTTDVAKLLNVDNAISSWIAAGAKPEKIIMGMATYGRTFTLSNSSNNGLNALAYSAGNAAEYTMQSGFMGYNEICWREKSGQWTKVWDDEQKTPYLYKDNQWIGYDDVRSFKIKSQYAVDRKLGGVMIWSIETDDFRDTCGAGKFPLLTAINNVLKGDGSTGGETTIPTIKPESSTKSSTSSTPTTEPTTTPKDNGNTEAGLCQTVGFVRDPVDCSVFYYCIKTFAGFQAHKIKCPFDLVFDTGLSVCNYRSAVKC